jgi:hypothetical protein
MADPTLGTLVAISRRRQQPTALCCPTCGGAITLAGGRLWCGTTERHGTTGDAGQSSGFGRLAELAVAGQVRRG